MKLEMRKGYRINAEDPFFARGVDFDHHNNQSKERMSS